MESVLKIIEQYGLWGVLGIILACGLVIGAKYFLKRLSNNVNTGFESIGKKLTTQLAKQNDQLTTTIVSQQEKLINYLVNKDENDKKNHNNMMIEKNVVSEEIKNSLRDIRNVSHASRVFILEFHNGNENLSGVPFPKYSCNYESFDRGLEPLTTRCKSLPISHLSRIISKINATSENYLIYKDMDQMANDNPELYWYMAQDDIRLAIYVGMYNKNNVFCGLIGIEFSDSVNIDNLVNLNQLEIKSAELTQLLNLRYKYDKA